MYPTQLSLKNVDKRRGKVPDNLVYPIGNPVKGRQDNDIFKSLKKDGHFVRRNETISQTLENICV